MIQQMRLVFTVMATFVFAIGLFGLAAGVPSVAEAGGGCHADGMSDAAGTEVRMEGACFTPTVLRVQPGDRVTWTNYDSFAHAVTGAGRTFGDYAELGEGQAVSHELPAAGVYPYFCNLHPGMIGAVVVGDGIAAQQSVAPVEGEEDGGSDRALVAGIASGSGALVILAVAAAFYAVRRR